MTARRKPATTLNVAVTRKEYDSGLLLINVVCSFLDEDFSPRVASGECFVSLVHEDSGEKWTGQCVSNSGGEPCTVVVDVSNANFETPTALQVRYGLTSSLGSLHSDEIRVSPSAAQLESKYNEEATSIPVTDNVVLYLPQRPLYAGESFMISVVVRGSETVSQAKFAIDLANATQLLEYDLASISEIGRSTWDLTMGTPIEGRLVFIMVKKPDATSIFAPNEDQHVLSMNLRVATTLLGSSDAKIGVQVYEFGVGINPEVPPGGVVIPSGGYASGSVIARPSALESAPNAERYGVYLNQPGLIKLRQDTAVSLVAQLET